MRFGSSPEYFSAEVLPRLAKCVVAVTAVFGNDVDLLALLDHGEIDLAVTSTTPSRRSLRYAPIGMKRFTLVAAPQAAPTPRLQTLRQLADWLPGQPWASYSLELPITRRFWQTVLERPFSARSHLVAPDLRAVLRAVELGIGVSLLPTFVCNEPLADSLPAGVFGDLWGDELLITKPADRRCCAGVGTPHVRFGKACRMEPEIARPVVTVFRSRLCRDAEANGYAELALRMEDRARAMPGFIDFKSFTAPDGERVSVIVFDTIDHQHAWRDDVEHRAAQQRGRDAFYSEYSISVCQELHRRSFQAEHAP